MRVLTIFLVSVFSNGEEYFNITRQSSSLSEDFPDIVQFSPSECGDNKGATCSTMGASKTADDCQCTCNETDDRIQYKGTFGFLEGQWKCQNNTVVRKHAGCLLSEDEEYDPIKTISSHNNISSSLQLGEIHFSTFVVQRLVANNASFLGCDGEWSPLDGATISRSFHLTSDGKSISVNKSLDPSRLGGLIIRLAVDSFNYTSTQCVLFKIVGHQICPVSSQSSLPLPSSSITTLHIILIATLLGASVLVVVVTVAVLMTKLRRVRRRHARQPFVTQMSSLAENNEYTDESLDAIEIDQSHDDDGYLHPLDEAVPRGKEHESKRLSARELNSKRQAHAHMEQPKPSNILQGKNVNYYDHCCPTCEIKSRVEKMDDVFESLARDGSPRYKDSQTSLNEPHSSCPKQSKVENEKRSSLEPLYFVLEAPPSYSASSASEELRHNTLPNLRDVAMETNRGNKKYVVNEAEQVMTRNAPRQKKNNYEQLHFDGQQCFNDYQPLYYVTRKKEEE